MTKKFKIDDMLIGQNTPLVLIAGPCVIENFETTHKIASYLKDLTSTLDILFVFKASYDKANRTSVDAFRGPGIDQGLAILEKIKRELNVSIISDVHQIEDVGPASEILDIIQIPAFLCRQTDLLLAVGNTGKTVNIKKGQFLAPWDMGNAVEKVKSTGNHDIFVTERGAMFGYNNLVVDFRSIKIMQDMGFPVIFDATHSVQLPGGDGSSSGGQREFAPILARSAVAAGASGIFMEVHPDPDNARCDGPNSLQLEALPELLKQLIAVRNAVRPASTGMP